MRDWKGIVAAVAPALATALGGPLAGVATQALSASLLGGKADGTEAEIASAIQAGGPDALVKIREAENALTVRLRELDIDLERVQQADRASARQREAKTGDSWTPRMIAGAIVVGWLCVQWFMLGHVIPAENRELVMRALGTLDAALMFVLGYYFGSSRGSDAKTELLTRKA